jgi:predicted Zn-dependent peptidase
VVTERIAGVRSIALGLWIEVGSRDERAGHAGVSHFIEHLVFKGTKSYSAWDIARIFDRMGGEINAATAKDHTVVHARFLDEHLDEAFAVMADMVARPLMADLDAEREVVLEEVALYEDSPAELIHDYLAETVFWEHPLARSIVGTSATLQACTRPVVRGYHRRHYVNPAMVVAAAGHVDHARLCDLAARHFDGHTAGSPPPRPEMYRPKRRHDAYFLPKETEQFHVCLGAPALTRTDKRRWALSVLDTILGGSSSSRLFQEVREKRGLVYSVYSYASLYADTGLAAIYFGSRPEGLDEVMRICLDQLTGLADTVTADEVERAKDQFRGQLVLGMESPGTRMSRLGRSVLMGLEIETLNQMLARIGRVTHRQVVDLARRLYDPAVWSAVCIGPEPSPFRETVGDFAWEEEPA